MTEDTDIKNWPARKEKFDEKMKSLNFTKEEEFKVEQMNELIEAIDKLRRTMIR